MKFELPYEIGMFVKAKSKIDGVQILGTVAAYELKKAKKYIDEEPAEKTNKFYAFPPPMPNPPCAIDYWEDFEEK